MRPGRFFFVCAAAVTMSQKHPIKGSETHWPFSVGRFGQEQFSVKQWAIQVRTIRST